MPAAQLHAATPAELKRLETERSNASFHYLGSAKIYSRIGEAFAQAYDLALKIAVKFP